MCFEKIKLIILRIKTGALIEGPYINCLQIIILSNFTNKKNLENVIDIFFSFTLESIREIVASALLRTVKKSFAEIFCIENMQNSY